MAEISGSRPDDTVAAPARNLSVDYYRVSGVLLIVFGHWLLSSVTYTSGEFGLEQPLVDIPWTQWLVWLMQAVPVFFLAAGYASAVSWAHWRDTGRMTRQEWVRRRLSSTLGPTGAYLALIWTVIIIAELAGAPAAVLSYAGWAVAMQLWFLAVYSIVVYLTPICIAAQRRWRLWVPAALGLGVAAVDLLSIAAGVPYLHWINYLLCWGAMYTLGIAWYHNRIARLNALAMLAGSAVMLVILIGYGPYPVCMIDVPGQAIQNSSPPSLAMFFFGCGQAAIAVLLGPLLTRALSGRRTRGVLAVANNNVMALYLWHMVPVVVVAAIAYPAGLLPQFPENSGMWWLMRLAWVSILAVVTAAEMLVLLKLRRVFAAPLPTLRVPLAARWTDVSLLAGIVLAAYGIAVVSAVGFAPDGLVPWHAIAAFAVGAVLVAITPGQRHRS